LEVLGEGEVLGVLVEALVEVLEEVAEVVEEGRGVQHH
jgi:hypothetical protein